MHQDTINHVMDSKPLTELGKELQDILTLGTMAGLNQEQLCAAFLGRVGVTHSCWQRTALDRSSLDSTLKYPSAPEA